MAEFAPDSANRPISPRIGGHRPTSEKSDEIAKSNRFRVNIRSMHINGVRGLASHVRECKTDLAGKPPNRHRRQIWAIPRKCPKPRRHRNQARCLLVRECGIKSVWRPHEVDLVVAGERSESPERGSSGISLRNGAEQKRVWAIICATGANLFTIKPMLRVPMFVRIRARKPISGRDSERPSLRISGLPPPDRPPI